MRILWIATKAPWPPVDGGRLVQGLTLRALADRGARLTLVAPVDPRAHSLARARRELEGFCRPRLVAAAPRSRLLSLARSAGGDTPFSVIRHRSRTVALEVEKALAGGEFEVVHVEQLQAWPQAEPALRRGLPVVLRAQNVESDLWAALAEAVGGAKRRLARREARLLSRWEGEVVRRASATVALTLRDADRLAFLSGTRGASEETERVERIPAPFPAELARGRDALAGSPAVVLFGSSGWLPNREANRFFVAEVWPEVATRLPGARLHLFGDSPVPHSTRNQESLRRHPSPEESREAFAPGSILAVPLSIASGVRIKILEAWSRGVPVVAAPAAAAGLSVTSGDELLLAEAPEDFAAAFERLSKEPDLRARLCRRGRLRLARDHDPEAVAARLLEIYSAAAG